MGADRVGKGSGPLEAGTVSVVAAPRSAHGEAVTAEDLEMKRLLGQLLSQATQGLSLLPWVSE